MKIHRFFIEENIKQTKNFRTEDKELIHQLRDVFRLGKGDKVNFFDGTGYEYLSEIEMLAKKGGSFVILEKTRREERESRKIHLYLAIIKKDKIELAIEKATELGVASITPVIAERSQYKQVREDRLKKLVKEAAEHSGRTTLPEVRLLETVEEVIARHQDVLVLHIDGTPFSEVSFGKEVCVLIGPEGGWSEKELELFKEKNIRVVSLPFGTLRAETAAIVASATAQM